MIKTLVQRVVVIDEKLNSVIGVQKMNVGIEGKDRHLSEDM